MDHTSGSVAPKVNVKFEVYVNIDMLIQPVSGDVEDKTSWSETLNAV